MNVTMHLFIICDIYTKNANRKKLGNNEREKESGKIKTVYLRAARRELVNAIIMHT